MSIIRIQREPAQKGEWVHLRRARVSFAYDPALVEIIRSVPGRKWLADRKLWEIPDVEVDLTARMFATEGCTVYVDGEPWHAHQKPPPRNDPPPRPGSNPFLPLFAQMPEHLRMPAWKALQKVVHPDVGGDTVLSQKLNDAKPERAAS